MGVPFLVPTQKGSSDKAVGKPVVNPVDVYLNRLGPGSRRGMHEALDGIASFISGGTMDAKAIDWKSIRYHHTSAVRGWLVKTYAPATTKRIISALKGVLADCWRLGLIAHDDYARAIDLAPIRGETESRGRALTTEELARLFQSCAADQSPAGIRDGAILGCQVGEQGGLSMVFAADDCGVGIAPVEHVVECKLWHLRQELLGFARHWI